MASTFTSSIPGEDKAESSSFTVYQDKVSDAIEQLLPKGADGYAVLLRKGSLPGCTGAAAPCCFPWSEPCGEPLDPAHAALYRAVRSRIAHALLAAEQCVGQIWPRSISTGKGAATLRTPVNTSPSR